MRGPAARRTRNGLLPGRSGPLLVVLLALASTPAAAQWNEYPTTAAEAAAYFEGDPDEWLEGPVEYISLREERSVWDDLETTEQRQAFIRWFWARRDPDPRDEEHPLRQVFYERVASANQRFRGFPRGWKGDRGRVWITLGRPDSMSHRDWFDVVGRGSGPDFEIWTYFTNARNRGFRSAYGEYAVYFIESAPGRAEIWDPRFGTGSYPPSLRRAFEYTAESYVADSTLEFDPEASEGEFVRSAAESELPVEVPLGSWGDPGAAGILVVPVRVDLGDLLFRTTGDGFATELEVELVVTPESGERRGARKEWALRLTQEQLSRHGSGSVLMAMVVGVDPGTHQVQLGVRESLAEATGRWSGSLEVSDEDGEANVAVGSAWVELGEGANAGAGILGDEDAVFEPGADLVVAVWPHRSQEVETGQVGLSLRGLGDQGELAPELASGRWIPEADQLLLATSIPETAAGDYEAIVSLDGVELGRARLTVRD